MPAFLLSEYGDNAVIEWFGAVVIMLAALTGLYVLRSRVLARVEKLALRMDLRGARVLFDAFKQTRGIVLFSVALYIGARSLVLPAAVMGFLQISMIVLLCLQAGLWATHLLKGAANYYRAVQLKKNPGVATTIDAVRLILSIVIWSSVFLLILDNLGFNIATLIAGLGIGGIAVALALQGVLGDLFASLFIVIDKTFNVGDFLVIDEYMGTVEYIGWKTTRLRSLSGEQLIFSNSNMLSSRMRNYGRMYRRRVETKFKVSPKSTRAQLRLIPKLIREAIEVQEKTFFDRAHFKSFDRAPTFEYIYFVESPDYNLYMDIQQNINLYLHEKFEEENILLQRDDIAEFVIEQETIEMLRETMQRAVENREMDHFSKH